MTRPLLRVGEIGKVSWEKRPGGALRAVARTRDGGGVLRRLSSTRETKDLMLADLRRQAAELVYAGSAWSRQTALREVVEEWLAHRRAKQRGRPQTLDGYERVARGAIFPRLGERAVGDITPPTVMALMSALDTQPRAGSRDGYSASYRKLVLIVLRGSFDHAIRLGILETNPARAEETPIQKPQVSKSLTPAQVEAVREAVRRWEDGGGRGPARGPLLRLAIELGLASGGRLGEVLAFQNGGISEVPTFSVALTGTIVEARGGAVRQPALKGADKERRLPLPEWSRAAVEEARSRAVDGSPSAGLLQTSSGRFVTPTYVQKRVRQMREEQKELLESAGIVAEDFSFHALRATVLAVVDAAAGIEAARAQAGHSRAVTTRGYLPSRAELPLVEGTVDAIQVALAGR